MKKVMVISTSMRVQSNTDQIADAFVNGARSVGHDVIKVEVKDLHMEFCRGCLACQRTHQCVIQDDLNKVFDSMKTCDVVVFATPVYFYEMSGQMKTFLDRSNPLFDTDYKFRDIYLLTAAAEEEREAMEGTVQGLQGWISCFPNTQLKKVIYGNGLTNGNDIEQHTSIIDETIAIAKAI